MSPPPPEHDVIAAWARDQVAAGSEPTHPRRCGRCRQIGHNRNTCPHSASVAREMALTHVQTERAARRSQVQAVRDGQALSHALARLAAAEETNTHLRERMEGQHQRYVVLLREHERLQDGVYDYVAQRRSSGPSRMAATVQEIVFENADKIPDGIYKQLMDALMIRD